MSVVYREGLSLGVKPGSLSSGTFSIGGMLALKLDGGLIIVPNSLAEA